MEFRLIAYFLLLMDCLALVGQLLRPTKRLTRFDRWRRLFFMAWAASICAAHSLWLRWRSSLPAAAATGLLAAAGTFIAHALFFRLRSEQLDSTAAPAAITCDADAEAATATKARSADAGAAAAVVAAEQWCVHCRREVRPLERHCRQCGCCVAGREHHCDMFDVCIGDHNRLAFDALCVISMACTLPQAVTVLHASWTGRAALLQMLRFSLDEVVARLPALLLAFDVVAAARLVMPPLIEAGSHVGAVVELHTAGFAYGLLLRSLFYRAYAAGLVGEHRCHGCHQLFGGSRWGRPPPHCVLVSAGAASELGSLLVADEADDRSEGSTECGQVARY